MYFVAVLLSLWSLISIASSEAAESGSVQDFSFASYYQDNMVLQAAPRNAVLWGYGTLHAKVEISINVYEKYQTVVGKGFGERGVWSVTFKTHAIGTKAVISGSHMSGGKMTVYRITNVLFGDVWLCGGQSNMVFPLAHMLNATEELQAVSNYPDIRIFTVAQVASPEPLYDLQSITQNWAVPSAETAQYFSAVCWLYAKHVHDKLKIPIGLVSSNWGGTPIEVWSSPRALTQCNLAGPYTGPVFTDKVDPAPRNNSGMWNAMIHPLLNMTITGALWYQGEANSDYHRDAYNCSFPAMINDWRSSWYEATGHQTDPTFPFGFVQLAPTGGTEQTFPVMRWHQTADFGDVPNAKMQHVFMAVAMDLPDPNSPYGPVHSRHKEEVGQRLAMAGLFTAYKVGGFVPGPLPNSAVAVQGGVLLQYHGKHLEIFKSTNFDVCCRQDACDVSDVTAAGQKQWHAAPIVFHGPASVLVTDGACPNNVKRVRYAWATVPCSFEDCAVYNNLRLPAPPFVMDVQQG